MRTIKKIVVGWVVGLAVAAAAATAAAAPAGGAAAEKTLANRIEMLDWSDPDRAAQLIDTPGTADHRESDIEMLEVRGMVYADVHRDADVDTVIASLQAMAKQGNQAAALGERYVRAYSLYQRDQYTAANAELVNIDMASIATDTERYRVSILRGNVLRMLGQAEAALQFLEGGLDIAHEMHDDLRSLHAMLWLARIYTNTGNLDKALGQLESSRRLAMALGDDAALVEVEGGLANIADSRGDHAEERRSSLAALEHATRSGSNKWLAHALINLGDSYLQTRDFNESLKYSRMALPIVLKLRESGDKPIVLFNQGLAYIGLGSVKQGQRLAEDSIAETLAGDNLVDAKQLLREYADALEHAGYLMMAIQIYHRYDELSEKLMSSTRQRSFLELSAKFDDERRARELELLRRDNELKASEMRGQRLQKQFILAASFFITCICGALIWAFARVRKANDRLRFNSERDALTGLHNRRYFNEQVLTIDGTRPVVGCVLLADLDHFKRINDTLGHPAGDAVLATVSQRLAAALRDSDKLVRWGGEEFLAVLNPITPAQADSTVERLLAAVRRDPVLWNGQAIHCSISIGYACFPMPGSTTDVTLEGAISLVDKALYEAKRRGRDRACLISGLSDLDESQLMGINGEFEAATADRRIRMVEMGAAAA